MKQVYENPNASIEERVNDLVIRMTLEEKVGQLNQTFCGWDSYKLIDGIVVMTDEFKKCLLEGGAGAVYGMHRTSSSKNGKELPVSPSEGAYALNEIQKFAIENSRFGIPLLVSEECPKGFNAAGATIFPSPLAYSSSWNRSLSKKIGKVCATEIRAGGGHIGYGPVLDICHDPRWSRMEENYGEDPYLAGELGTSLVHGLQGDNLSNADSVISTLKHFAAYGNTEGGRNTAPAHMGERELRSMHLPSFEAAVKAGAKSVMCSYNEIDGIPVSASRQLLTEILREEWGFDGFVVSDALAIDELCIGNDENKKHRVAKTLAEAGALAVEAGLDLSLWDKSYLYLEEAVQSGLVDERVIDKAVKRILSAKFELGLFENPYVTPEVAAKIFRCKEHVDLSIEASRQSIVLLKNDGILPIDKSKKIAVIGPSADNIANMLGTYTPDLSKAEGVTVLDGFKTQANSPDLIGYSLGCRIKDPSTEWLSEAITLAKNSDVVVAVVGGSSKQDIQVKLNENGQIQIDAARENDIDCGENIDRADLHLAGIQEILLTELKKTGKPLVVVLVQGRTYETAWTKENANGLICCWYPGPYGGKAIAEAIYGDFNPSGKLTVSFPKTIGQIPINYNHKATAQKRYLDYDVDPLYKFGFGLSYTSFEYSDPEVEVIGDHQNLTVLVSVKVKNTGTKAGTEIVQLYVRDEYSTVTTPVNQLKGFERINLKVGEVQHVQFTLHNSAFSLWNRQMKQVVEPGEFTISVGGGLDLLKSIKIDVN